jgi:hypothetical protein
MPDVPTDVITTKPVYGNPLEFAPNALPADKYVEPQDQRLQDLSACSLLLAGLKQSKRCDHEVKNLE